MPKIDPNQLLDSLDSVLGSTGGIKGEAEVTHLVESMTQVSKKLVSKCIYILILKNTEPDLLAKFMAEGGWALVFQWLDEGINNNNYPLICEILELLLKCPISLERLKENNCPKVVKGLSKYSECEEVKRLAGKLVQQWLKFITSDNAAISDVNMTAVSAPVTLSSNVVVATVQLNSVSNARKITAKPGIQLVHKAKHNDENEDGNREDAEEEEEEEEEIVPPIGSLPLYKITPSIPTNTVQLNSVSNSDVKKSSLTRKITAKPGIHIVHKTEPCDENENEDREDAEEEDEEEEEIVPPIGSLPLYKITVRDGKSVLAKVGTKKLTLPVKRATESNVDPSGVTSVILKSDPVTKRFRYVTKSIGEKDKSNGSEKHSEDKSNIQKSISLSSECLSKSKIIVLLEKNDVQKSEEAKAEKTDDGKSKHGSSKSPKDSSKSKDSSNKSPKSSTENEIFKNDAKHKDKERKSSRELEKDRKKSEHKSHKTEKSRDKDRDRDREKDKLKRREKDTGKEKHKDGDRDKEKEKEKSVKEKETKTLSASEKAQIQADKDKSTLERLKTPAISLLGKIPKKSSSQTGSSNASNSSVNKTPETSGDIGGDGKKLQGKSRPKTVKTFNSKFRSTGLEEEIKPPPSRATIKKKLDEKRPMPSKISTTTGSKDGGPPEKKLKMPELNLDLKKDKVLEKTGGIKLIPPKPKRFSNNSVMSRRTAVPPRRASGLRRR